MVGSPIPLTASATCDDGVTAEFEYWVGTPTSTGTVFTSLSGTAITLGDSYVPGGSSYTPSAAGSLCFEVAARAAGSGVDYQTRSSSACGTISGSTTTTTVFPSGFAVVAGSAFQLAGNVDAVTQLFVAQVNTLVTGQSVTAGSVAVECAGAGGGYVIPCERVREIGAWQCGAAVACGTSSSAAIPFSSPFTIGSQAHLDLGILAVAQAFVPVTAVLSLQ